MPLRRGAVPRAEVKLTKDGSLMIRAGGVIFKVIAFGDNCSFIHVRGDPANFKLGPLQRAVLAAFLLGDVRLARSLLLSNDVLTPEDLDDFTIRVEAPEELDRQVDLTPWVVASYRGAGSEDSDV
ncbi:MAG: hypothetical protein DRO06_03140 [Thermoproteota archaeon]|nr:MAG: hypothetical protein DRO06_03140 [Candidatus Korarchaeota archaeon]